MQRFYFICLALLLTRVSGLFGQQIQYQSPLSGADFIFNPGMTAPGQIGQVGVTHRQQWMAFAGAPQTATVFGQFPVAYEKMSVGLYVRGDRVGAFESIDFAGSYNYKFEIGLFRNDQLSLGVSGGMKQLRFDPSKVIATSDTDVLLSQAERADLRPQFAAGFLYTTNKDVFAGYESAFYIGAGGSQLLPSEVRLFAEGGYRMRIHTNGIIGARFAGDALSFRPEVRVDYTFDAPVFGTLSFTFEAPAFWAGGGYRTDNTFTLFGGGVINIGDYRNLRIGVAGDYNIGYYSTARGFGVEAVIVYEIEI